MSKVSKTQKFDLTYKRAAFIIPEMLPNEEFRMITDIAAPGVLPYYAISNYGRIWHIYENYFMSTSWDGAGYRIAVLRYRDGRARTNRVHRLLMLTFRYEEYLQMQQQYPNARIMVNHINGIKTSNYINFPEIGDNLEWVTGSQNEIKAFETGLKSSEHSSGENHGNAKHTNEEIRQLCQMLDDGVKPREICAILNVPLYLVDNIRCGKSWTSISKDYNFMKNYLARKNSTTSTES